MILKISPNIPGTLILRVFIALWRPPQHVIKELHILLYHFKRFHVFILHLQEISHLSSQRPRIPIVLILEEIDLRSSDRILVNGSRKQFSNWTNILRATSRNNCDYSRIPCSSLISSVQDPRHRTASSMAGEYPMPHHPSQKPWSRHSKSSIQFPNLSFRCVFQGTNNTKQD